MGGLRTIPLQETCQLDKVQQFLNTVGRNSNNSKRIYAIALAHFQVFLQDKYSPATVETVLEVLSNGHK